MLRKVHKDSDMRGLIIYREVPYTHESNEDLIFKRNN